MNECKRVAGFDPKAVKETLNKWALSECAKAINEVAAGIQAYKFNEAALAAYRFVWNVFCDWTLELSKPVLQGADSPAKDETRATIAFIFDEICKLLHPFMPFLTEELWAVKGQEGPKRETILALAPWSKLDRSDRSAGRGRDRLGGGSRQRDPLRPLRDERAGRRADPARARGVLRRRSRPAPDAGAIS